MVDWRPTDAELDAWIESTLQEEPLVNAPAGLHAKINERIQLAALEQKERSRFRNTLLSGLAACVGIVTATGLVLAWTNFYLLIDHGVSGGLGFVDYYTSTFQLPWPVRPDGFFLLMLMGLGIVTIWAGLQPFVRQGMVHPADGRQGEQAMAGRLARTR